MSRKETCRMKVMLFQLKHGVCELPAIIIVLLANFVNVCLMAKMI